MSISIRALIAATALLIAVPAFAQEPPKAAPGQAAKKGRPVAKMTEDDIRKIAEEEVGKAADEARRAIDEVKRQADEAVRRAEEAKAKAVEEAAKAIAEARRAAEDGSRAAAAQAKAAVEENSRVVAEQARERADHGPGWVLPADWALKPRAALKVRTELRTNNSDFRATLDDKNSTTGQYAEVGLEASWKSRIRAAIVVQDVRTWGQEGMQTGRSVTVPIANKDLIVPDLGRFASMYTGNYGTSLAEGWMQLGAPDRLSLKVGRMPMYYGDGRILGTDDWSISPVSFDAAQLRWAGRTYWFELMAAKPRERELVEVRAPSGTTETYDTPGDDLAAIYLATHWVPGARLDLYLFFNRQGPYPSDQSGEDRLLVTPGLRIKGGGETLTYNAEVAGQFGKNRGKDHSALAADAVLGLEFDGDWEPGVQVEYAFATGDKGDSGSTQFLEFFPAHDLRFGLLGMAGWSNIHELRIGGDMMPVPDLLLSLDVRYLMLASSRGWWSGTDGIVRGWDSTGASGRDLGWEIDVKADWDYNQWLSVQAGYGIFIPLGYVADLQPIGTAAGQATPLGADAAQFGYVMLKLSLDRTIEPPHATVAAAVPPPVPVPVPAPAPQQVGPPPLSAPQALPSAPPVAPAATPYPAPMPFPTPPAPAPVPPPPAAPTPSPAQAPQVQPYAPPTTYPQAVPPPAPQP